MFYREEFMERMKGKPSVGIAGHLRPDGDCVGACVAMYCFLRDNFGIEADIFLDEVPSNLKVISGCEHITTTFPDKPPYDVFIALDCGDFGRLGKSDRYIKQAVYSYCIDHHTGNEGFASSNLVIPDAPATCEVLFDLFGADMIGKETAAALYLGIVHDTGMFRYGATTRHTMEIVGTLMEKDIPFTAIVDGSFYTKSYLQNQILGRCLMESILCMDGRVIVSYVDRKIQALYGLSSSDTDGVIEQLRDTEGVEVAILLKEMNPRVWKVGLRSCRYVDVAAVCSVFGGGGHIRAAGCLMSGSLHDVINNLTREIEKQISVVLPENHERTAL